jgi:HEAT repeat protein
MSSLAPVIALLAVLAAAASTSGDASAPLKVVEDPGSSAAATRQAVQQLGERLDARAVPALIKLLHQPRQGRTLEAEAALALFQIGRPAGDALLRVLRGKDSALVAWGAANHVSEAELLTEAASVLGDMGDARAEAPLLELLRYESPNKGVELAVRGHAASTLGRLHAKAAVAPLAAMVTTTNLQARVEAVRALVLIGDRQALPALARAAGEGEWQIRKVGMNGFTLVGDDRELPAYQKILQHEEDVITSDCRAHPNYHGCEDQKKLLAQMLGDIHGYAKRLEAAGHCKEASACWTAQLKEVDPGVRERAALELARQRSSESLDALFAAAGDADAAVRFTAVQGLEWRLANDARARAQGARHLPELEARLQAGQGSVAEARLDAPLRRLVYRIRRAGRASGPAQGRRP